MTSPTAAPLWPALAGGDSTSIEAFARRIEHELGVDLPDYASLWNWSTENLDAFWSTIWDFFGVGGTAASSPALANEQMPGAQWFPGARVNAAEVFRGRDQEAPAVVEAHEAGEPATVSWAQLEGDVAAVADELRSLGVGPGDRVAGYLANTLPALVAFLATASLGAIWSCCGPDYAAPAAATRLAQLKPTVLVCADGCRFAGVDRDRRAELAALAGMLPTVTAVLYCSQLDLEPPAFDAAVSRWSDIIKRASGRRLRPTLVSFDHPLWVLYSSGTTGAPKGLVHSHGGAVLESLKTIGLHFDLRPADPHRSPARLFWYTTTNWMMWNFNVSALLVGASVVLYDGSPTEPTTDRLWRLVADLDVSVLGTSPGYLRACEKDGVVPTSCGDLSSLRVVGVTGSPVTPASSRWLHQQFGGRVPLAAISGGTDIVAALAGWAPTVPTWPGEMSCPALGVALDTYPQGQPVRGTVGELVITRPMPSMPVYLWNDPDGRRYRETYFSVFPGIWRHGDWATLTDRGTVVIHGRSDATLNRNGIRIGSAEVYDIVEAVDGIRDSLVVGVDLPGGGYWLPLFVVLDDATPGVDQLGPELIDALRRNASPRHVPDDIVAVAAIPRTRTGKKLEIPVKRLLLGEPLEDVLSVSAVENPEALVPFVELGRHLAASDTENWDRSDG